MKKIWIILISLIIFVLVSFLLILASVPKKYVREDSLNCIDLEGVCMISKEDCDAINNSMTFDNMGCEEELNSDLAICCVT